MTGGIIPTPKKRQHEPRPPSDVLVAHREGQADGLRGLPPRVNPYRSLPLLMGAYRTGYQRGTQERAAADRKSVV